MLVRLTNGTLFNLDNVAYIIQAQLNKWAIVPQLTAVPELPTMDSHCLDELLAELKERNLFVEVKPLPRVAETTESRRTANETGDKKIEIAPK